jgi:hypothetical protein
LEWSLSEDNPMWGGANSEISSDVSTMLPPEILDQVTSLTTQHREIVSIINQLSRPSEIKSQLILDDLVAKIKAGFAQADRAVEVRL